MRMIHLGKREFKILIVTVFISISALSYNFLFDPFIKNWKALNSEIISKQVKLQKSLKILEQKPQNLKKHNLYYTHLKGKPSNEEEMTIFLSQIEGLAKRSNLSLKEVKPGKVKDMRLYKEFTCNVEIEADITEISRFMYEMAKPPYLLKTKRFELRSKGGKDSRLKGSLLITKLTLL